MQPGGDYAFSVFDSKYLDQIGGRWDLIGGQGMAPLSTVGETFDRNMLEQDIDRTVAGDNGFKADTLSALAALMDVPAEALIKTVSRYNALAASGDDTDFGKRGALLTSVGWTYSPPAPTPDCQGNFVARR